MQPDSDIPPSHDNVQPGELPPVFPPSNPPSTGIPPLLMADSPAPLPSQPHRKSGSAGGTLANFLSLCLGLFLADGVVSLLDESLILLFDVHLLGAIRGILLLFTVLLAIVIHGMMGLTPMIPKRLFLPVTLFIPLAGLATIPLLIYHHTRTHEIAWGISLCQVILGLGILHRVQHGWRFRWPFVAESRLEPRRFAWRNLIGFALAHVFLGLPAILVYLVVCAVLAVDHFTDGFLALRSEGLTVRVRKYVRDDGRTIQLFPMAHIGEPDFYRKLSESFPTNSIVLMEGVTDNGQLLTNKITYKRMATSLGLAEQQKEFKPQGKIVRADLDVGQFAPTTIDFLNLVMLVQNQGMNDQVIQNLLRFSTPDFERHFFDDLLGKRNRHLLNEIQIWLPKSDLIIVPWGAAHMPEIGREIQKSGFHLTETQEYVAIRFRSLGNKGRSIAGPGDSGSPK
ncbi:MAG: hypothetical protein H7X97_09525 [Opitutaceae bacterium]|nr:hypothetical protein [Verrucomicrobiales bacterium]